MTRLADRHRRGGWHCRHGVERRHRGVLGSQLRKHHMRVGALHREPGDEPRPEPEQVIDRAGAGNALDVRIGPFGELRCNHPGDV